MEIVLLTLIVFQSLGFAVFGKFESESPWWRSPVKWSAITAFLWIVNYYYGTTITFVSMGLLYTIALIVHFSWCYKNKIHPVKATPRRKYFELRGWKWEE